MEIKRAASVIIGEGIRKKYISEVINFVGLCKTNAVTVNLKELMNGNPVLK